MELIKLVVFYVGMFLNKLNNDDEEIFFVALNKLCIVFFFILFLMVYRTYAFNYD